MYQNIANQNPIMNVYNGYAMQNPNVIPFQNNHLINNNVHVMNNLNGYVQQYRSVQENMPALQQQMNQMNQVNQMNPMNSMNQTNPMNQMNSMNQMNTTNKNSKSNKMKNINIIKNMLQPEKIIKNGNTNKDVDKNYKTRKHVQKEAKKGNIGIEMTNAPYKNIIKDKIPNKAVDAIKKEDLIVHTVRRGAGGDDDLEIFEAELKTKKKEKKKINDELKIEFDIENYDKHKKKFDYKETFIRNLNFEQNTFDESKQDYIDFYRQRQKEAEDGLKLCDKVLENFMDDGIIGRDELPLEKIDNDGEGEIDLKTIMANVVSDKIYDFSNNSKQKSSLVEDSDNIVPDHETNNRTKKKIISTTCKKSSKPTITPSNKTAKPTINVTTKSTTNSSNPKSTSNKIAKPTINVKTKSTTNPSNPKSTSNKTAKPIINVTTNSTTNPSIKTTTNPSINSTTNPSTKSTTNPSTKSTTNPSTIKVKVPISKIPLVVNNSNLANTSTNTKKIRINKIVDV